MECEEGEIVTVNRDVDQAYLDGRRREIERRFLITVPGFGKVIFREDQAAFDAEVGVFTDIVMRYAQLVKTSIERSMKELVQQVCDALMPALSIKTPERFCRWGNPSDDDLRAMLECIRAPPLCA